MSPSSLPSTPLGSCAACLLRILGSGEDTRTQLSLALIAQAHYRYPPDSCSASENRTSELTLCMFQSDPQGSLNNLFVDIKRPRLEANQ